MAEEPLSGGISNAGRVTRDGSYLLRPANPATPSIHKLLAFLEDRGFDGAPRAFGIDADGRERLQFIGGEVPTVPYPDWSQSDTALASVAVLLRRFHDACLGFDPAGFHWSTTLADPAGGPAMCHNDVELSNVVFRDGVAIALIDFEFVAPGRPEYDVAHLVRLLAPVEHDFDRARMGWRAEDPSDRARLAADAYGLDRRGRADLLSTIDDAVNRIEAMARQQVEQDSAAAIAVMAGTGGIEKYDRRRRWWQAHRHRFAAALA